MRKFLVLVILVGAPFVFYAGQMADKTWVFKNLTMPITVRYDNMMEEVHRVKISSPIHVQAPVINNAPSSSPAPANNRALPPSTQKIAPAPTTKTTPGTAQTEDAKLKVYVSGPKAAESERPKIALTFNLFKGHYGDKILEVLCGRKIPATFFVTAKALADNPAFVKAARQAEYEVGLLANDSLKAGKDETEETVVVAEVAKPMEDLGKVLGYSPNLYRPLGRLAPGFIREIAEYKFAVVRASLVANPKVTEDDVERGSTHLEILETVKDKTNLQGGTVLQFNVGGRWDTEENTISGLQYVVSALKDSYEIVAVSKMHGLPRPPVSATAPICPSPSEGATHEPPTEEAE